MQLPLTHPTLGTWPTTQACALTGTQTGDPLVLRPALNPLSHTSQGSPSVLYDHWIFMSFNLLMLRHDNFLMWKYSCIPGKNPSWS